MKEQNGGVVLREKNGIFYYTVPLFESAGGVTAAFSTRRGGVSCGKLDSLNLGFSKPEPRENVQENYRRFFGALDLDPEKMVLTVQQHTDIILPDAHTRTGMGWADFPDVVADAEYTDDPDCVLVKLTADCVPVLLYAPDVRAVAAVAAHAAKPVPTASTIPPRTMPRIRVPAVVTIAMIMTVIAMRTMRSRPLLAVAVAVVAARTARAPTTRVRTANSRWSDAPASSSTSTRSLMWRAPLVSRPRSSAAVTTAVSAAARASSWNRTSSHAARTWTA